MIVFYSEHKTGDTISLHGDEAIHCGKVLRKSVGDEISVTDGMGNLYRCTIISVTKKVVETNIEETLEQQDQHSTLTIAIAPTKNISRYEWFLEKATEIGIKEVVPILTQHSERKVIKPERLEKIIVSAMKQSKNLHKPVLAPMVKLLEVIKGNYDHKYIAHCMEPTRHLFNLYNAEGSAIVLIGPEGDFSESEVTLAKENGWQEVSLGASRLRTETAGIVAAHTVSLHSQGIHKA